MIGAIRSAAVGTFKWGVSLIGPVFVTNLAMSKFKGFRELTESVPSVRNGIIGLFSLALLPRLTGCNWKTALFASSVIPFLSEVNRRRAGPSGGGGGSRGLDHLTEISSLHMKSNDRPYIIDDSKRLVYMDISSNLNCSESNNLPDVRFRELNEEEKQRVWSKIFSSMGTYAHYNPSQKLPFVGYVGETLVLVKTEESHLKLEAKARGTLLWHIDLNGDAIRSKDDQTQMYIELLIAKHTFFERLHVGFYSAFYSLIGFCNKRNTILDLPLRSFSMFNSVLAPYDLPLSAQTESVPGDKYTNKTLTFTKQSSSDPRNSLTLTIEWSEPNKWNPIITDNYKISIQRGALSERQTYTFTYKNFEWYMTCNQKTNELSTICDQLEQESIWNLEFNQDDMRDIFEMMQMSSEFLYSPYTVVFHQGSRIPYLTNGMLIPYERLKQIATYTNEAEGQSVLRVEGNRVLWGNSEVQEYSEPVESFDSENFEWDPLADVSNKENESGNEGESDDNSNLSHSSKSGSSRESSESSFE